ncbi:MAG: hypothetical protein MUF35_00085 [Candidatus Nanopelagicales bacterium]|jgi:hypothetical protein|nr:hypothetical protein [Candidatus Nanopelagicales bacterium]
MTAPEPPPRRVRWTWRTVGAVLLVAALLLALNALYRAGHQVLALGLLAAGLVAPGAWRLWRSRG